MTPQEQLQDLLRELFQLNNADLDFGIYRILNLKHKEVEEFITTHLPKRIEEVREKILARQSVDLRTEIEQFKQQLSANFQVDFQKEGDLEAKAGQYGQLPLFKEPYDKYIEAKKKLDALRVSEDTERAIYNELYRFFDRYYEGGDFISKPRSGANNYMIPYNGEEVKLYWANYDQYYIKTSENFKNYVFTNNSPSPENRITVEFKIVDAETTVNNNKDEKKRLFVPTEKPIEWDEQARKLTVSFYYKEPSAEEKAKWGEKQSVKKEGKGINQHLYTELEKAVKKTKDADLLRLWESKRRTSRGEEVPLFLYHLNRYTSINSFDYFIHKDLKGFLRRELDYFLKNEVLSVNFLDPDWRENEVQEAIKLNVLKASAIRDLALTIIDFLGELEDFQKRLWEKKKFVVQSDYCLTLDTITDETVLDAVLNFVRKDKEQKQIKEWVGLGFISGKKDLKDLKKKVKEGDSNLRYLVLDTQFLPEDLKWRLLASIDNLDERTNGLLINSENWQALQLLTPRFQERIQCTYIDPPYNTGQDGFAYKDSYRSSSWLSMIGQSSTLSKHLLWKGGAFFCSCDENEFTKLGLLLRSVFGHRNHVETLIWNKRVPKNDKGIGNIHEYIFLFAKDIDFRNSKELSFVMRKDAIEEIYELVDKCKRDGKDLVETQRLLKEFYRKQGFDRGITLYCELDPNYEIWGKINMSWPNAKTFGPRYTVRNPVTKKPTPIPERGWRWTEETFREAEQGHEYKLPDGSLIKGKIWYPADEKTQPSSITYLREVESFLLRSFLSIKSDGSITLDNLGLSGRIDYPKPVLLMERLCYSVQSNSGWFLDHFAGSATTAHAIINLNKDDKGNRRYLLVEIAKYFNSVTKPRVEKVIFSDKWNDGRPEKDGKGISQIFQYLKLEQYEDTLNNIEFTKDADLSASRLAEQLTIVDRLRYLFTYGAAESDCLLNVRKFTNPFGYTMKIVRQNEIVPEHPIDLVTTFNYFLGIDIKRYIIEKHQGREYRIVLGKKRQQEYIVVWRPFEEGKLDLTEERHWIKKQPWFNSEAIIFCNADNGFGARPTEAEFLRIMNEPVE